MVWYGPILRLWKGVTNVFKRDVIDPNDFRPITKAEYKAIGVATTARRYVSRLVSTVSKSTPFISVRQYQQAQHQTTLEKRGTLYASGAKPRLTRQSQVKYPRKLSHGRYLYEGEWSTISKFYSRVRGYEVQVVVTGHTSTTYEDEKGASWRTLGPPLKDGDELPELVSEVNSARGEYGFNENNQPELVNLHVWRKGRSTTATGKWKRKTVRKRKRKTSGKGSPSNK